MKPTKDNNQKKPSHRLWRQASEQVSPSVKLLARILDELPTPSPVTKEDFPRFISYINKQGRDFNRSFNYQTHDLMTSRWKALVSLIAVVAVIALVVFLGRQSEPQYATQPTPTPIAENIPPTGKIEDAVAAITLDAASESDLLTTDDSEAQALAFDSQTISDFGQAYESEF